MFCFRGYNFKYSYFNNYKRISTANAMLTTTVLGIETSCDDTGCAIVANDKVLGETLHSQNNLHVRYGGINPVIACELHSRNINNAVQSALNNASLDLHSVDAIAVTIKPGLLLCLQVGYKYAKFLEKKYGKPIIPIHHMEAHALTARMYHEIPFPHLVLLMSGGDCILAVALNVDDFLLLGKTFDNAPGEVMDKVARRMKLKNMPSYSKMSGGQAIEEAALKSTTPDMFKFPLPLLKNRDCNFSFSGLKDSVVRKLIVKELEHGIIGDGIIPEVNDMCAAFQIAITKHLLHRVKRAVMFCEMKNLIPSTSKNIVVSGGVACNNFIFNAIKDFGTEVGYKVFRPPSNVCTDNGIMIAWNGIEKIKANCHIPLEILPQDIEPNASFGRNIIKNVIEANLQVKVPGLYTR